MKEIVEKKWGLEIWRGIGKELESLLKIDDYICEENF